MKVILHAIKGYARLEGKKYLTYALASTKPIEYKEISEMRE